MSSYFVCQSISILIISKSNTFQQVVPCVVSCTMSHQVWNCSLCGSVRSISLGHTEAPTTMIGKPPVGNLDILNVDTWATSEITVDCFEFLWTIRKYSDLIANGEEGFTSPIFKGGHKRHGWKLHASPQKTIDDKEYLGVYLTLASFGDGDQSSTKTIEVRYEITLRGADGLPGKQEGGRTMKPCKFKRESMWGYDEFILCSDLISSPSRLLEEDTLNILCKIWLESDLIHTEPITKLTRVGVIEKRLKRKQDLGADFGRLLESSKNSDVTISLDNHTTIKAHKAILFARSSVFAEIFIKGGSEMNTLEIPEFEEEVVRGMLEYVYTGETSKLEEEYAPKLLQLADKYGLEELKEMCEYKIVDQLTLENAGEILVLACQCNAAQLKGTVQDYIKSYKRELQSTESFQRIARCHPSVFVELCMS